MSDGQPGSTSSDAESDKQLRLQKLRTAGDYNKDADPYDLLEEFYQASLLESPQELKSSYFWQAAGSYMVLIASPLGLLGNLSSIISLADKWRVLENGDSVSDTHWVLILNAIALASGCVSNAVLFLNFNQIIPPGSRYVPMVGYLFAIVIYMIMFGLTEYHYFHHSQYFRAQGYWQGAVASVLYAIASLLLFVNAMGKWLRKYHSDFNITSRQRRITSLVMLFIAWIAIGGAVMQHLLDINYANAVYFCLVSCSTLGYGDILATTNLSRALLIPYIYIGVVLMGLTAVILYQAIVMGSRESAIEHGVVRRRRQDYEKYKVCEGLTGEECFNLMRKIVKHEMNRSKFHFFIISFSWLLSFWLLGALIFSYTEKWSYFDAFYFVSISLAAVGYGDYVPTSPGGRSIFIIWCFLAPPTMAAAFSDITNVSFSKLDQMLETLSGSFLVKREPHVSLVDLFQQEIGMVDTPTGDFTMLRVLISMLMRTDSSNRYPFDIWEWAVNSMLAPKTEDVPVEPAFWLSDHSPIRFFIDERKCLLLICLHAIRGSPIAAMAEQELERSSNVSSLSDNHGDSEEDDGSAIVKAQTRSHQTAQKL